ncbi:MAG: TRAP transporter large permease [Ectothiorhodospiraceae bacterium]|nr:TRAP transporter large permease [Ectothiorhodospiraceae bacterium]
MMVVLMLTGMPLALAVGVAVALYIYFVAPVSGTIIPQRMLGAVDGFVLLAIPLFLLTGRLMSDSRIIGQLIHFSTCLVGWVRGGLAQVNVVLSVIISGISGSVLADTAATGSSLVPAMKRAGYGAGFSGALTAASASIGPIIPPSIIMVVLGGLTTVSIGRLFLGGVVPGLILAIVFGVIVYWISKKRNYPKGDLPTGREFVKSFFQALPALGLPLIIVGGILTGIFTATEAAAVAAVYTLLLVVATRQFSFRKFYRGVVDVGVATGAILFVVAIAGVLGWVLIMERAADGMLHYLGGFADNPTLVLALITLALLVLGCFIEIMALLILSIPLLMPVVQQVGIDPVHFGVVATLALTTGLITPPFGLSMFLTCRLSGIRMEEFAREVFPFLLGIGVVLVILIIFPQLVLYLPNRLMG